jgi:S1-C subfamily serine protease
LASKEKVLKAAVVLLLVAVIVFGAIAAYYSSALAESEVNARSFKQASAVEAENLGYFTQAQTDFNVSVGGLDPAAIYDAANGSVVTVQGSRIVTVLSIFGSAQSVESVFGSGFVVRYSGSDYVVTNYHVVDSLVNVTVTFWNGDTYAAKVIGSDPESDLAVLSVKASDIDLHPLSLASSSSVKVGQPVIAIGNPFGLSGSVTFGIVSQGGRTIQYQSSSNTFTVVDAIQFSAPINPGNSGGPLLDSSGLVVGITSAAVSGSQGVGFAIPSDAIIREVPTLVSSGEYLLHPYLGIQGTDMNYELAQVLGANVTYGVLVEQIASGGPADKAGVRAGQQVVTIEQQQYTIGGDIIVSVNGTRIVNSDAFSAYLEDRTLPGESVQLGILRSGTYTIVTVVVGTQPQ